MPLSDPRRQKQLQKLTAKLGLPENAAIQWSLLDLALTHPTFSPTANYEQLEFVGDAVARLTVAKFLFETYSACSVGELSAIRSVLVSDRSLAHLANSYGLERYLLVAPSAAKDSRGEESRLAEAFEALLGVLYLSSHNLELICPWLNPHLQQLAEEVRTDPAHQNYKAALQAWTQGRYRVLPEYRVQEMGQIHEAQRFTAEVWLNGDLLGQGTGRSMKAAEKKAAQVAFEKLQADEAGGEVR